MRRLLLNQVAAGGILTRAQALALVPRHVLYDAVGDGALAAVFPGVYALPATTNNRWLRRKAALAYLPKSALSHLDALDVWSYPNPPLGHEPVHISMGPGPPVRQPGLRVHQRRNFDAIPRHELRPHDLAVVEQEQAIVESWALLPERDRRAPLIIALRDRRTTPARLVGALDRQPNLAGVAKMRAMVDLVAGGCHSELELWGHARVFSDPRLPRSQRQYPVTIDGQRYWLDRYFEDEMVDVELDGAAFHGSPGQRERDLKRDARVSTRGILPVRYSHQRLTSDPDGAIIELLQILQVRRRQLGI